MTLNELKEKIEKYPTTEMKFGITDFFPWSGKYSHIAIAFSNKGSREENLKKIDAILRKDIKFRGKKLRFNGNSCLAFECAKGRNTYGRYLQKKLMASNETYEYIFHDVPVEEDFSKYIVNGKVCPANIDFESEPIGEGNYIVTFNNKKYRCHSEITFEAGIYFAVSIWFDDKQIKSKMPLYDDAVRDIFKQYLAKKVKKR